MVAWLVVASVAESVAELVCSRAVQRAGLTDKKSTGVLKEYGKVSPTVVPWDSSADSSVVKTVRQMVASLDTLRVDPLVVYSVVAWAAQWEWTVSMLAGGLVGPWVVR